MSFEECPACGLLISHPDMHPAVNICHCPMSYTRTSASAEAGLTITRAELLDTLKCTIFQFDPDEVRSNMIAKSVTHQIFNADSRDRLPAAPTAGLHLCEWTEKVDALTKELDEQCQINGKGAQRELRLMTERDAYRQALEKLVAAYHNSLAVGNSVLVRAIGETEAMLKPTNQYDNRDKEQK